jgi:hypothetical protein
MSILIGICRIAGALAIVALYITWKLCTLPFAIVGSVFSGPGGVRRVRRSSRFRQYIVMGNGGRTRSYHVARGD